MSEPLWQKLASQIVGFRTLKQNWDSYGAQPISMDCINRAISLLVAIRAAGIKAPHVVPRSDGGIEFEWYDEDDEQTLVIPAIRPDVSEH